MDEIQAFVDQQKEWLEAELHSSQQEAAAVASSVDEESRTTRVLTGLVLAQVSVGLYGRTVLELGTALASRLPAHRFTTGDEVELRSHGGGGGSGKDHKKGRRTQGVVSLVTDTTIALAISTGNNKNSNKKDNKKKSKSRNNNHEKDENPDEDQDEEDVYGEPPFTLVPSSSVEVHRKMVAALATLAQQGTQHAEAGVVIRALFDPIQQLPQKDEQAATLYAESTESFRTRLSNPNLDDSQVEAIQFALQHDRVVSLIHGPPGTGKTTTVVELIRQAVLQHKWRVLVTAPSNVAVDNVLSRLVVTSTNPNKQKNQQQRLRVVRMGHPARLQEHILPYSLEALVQAADGTDIVKDVRKELANYLKLLHHPKYETRATARREVRQLRQEVRQREEGVVKSILKNAQVVLATTVGAAAKILNQPETATFDLVVIDEAAQALEASCWIPILRGRRLVLAGDHCQLPPTIQSSDPKIVQGLGRTLFERVMHLYGDHVSSRSSSSNNDNKTGNTEIARISSVLATEKVSRMLKVQYRMNQRIADWASRALYGGQLQTHASCADQTLADMLPAFNDDTPDEDIELLRTPLLLIDTAGCGLHEETNQAGSRLNQGEAQIVRRHVSTLIQYGVTPPQIAVITPYNGQVETLRNLLLPDYPNLEIRSVDGFQGGERPVVVLSLVRSSARGGMDGIGFLRDDRRLNVAVTRAQLHCCVVADSETVSQSPFVKGLLEWIEEHGDTRSALEFLADTDSSTDAEINRDLVAAEIELSRMMQQNTATTSSKGDRTKRTKQTTKDSTEAVKELTQMIQDFVAAKGIGSELRLSTELSSRDRKLVHELAESLGIGHVSEGTDGVDRRLVLSIPKERYVEGDAVPTAQADNSLDGQTKTLDSEQDEPHTAADLIDKMMEETRASAFTVLDSSDDDYGDEDQQGDAEMNVKISSSNLPPNGNLAGGDVPVNHLLSNLALERASREQNKQKALAADLTSSKSNSTKSMPKPPPTKKKGNKLGGKTKAVPNDDGMEDLDDMAFLDAQIEQVQNSHGRKVDGKGAYRTIVNGILLSRPKEREAPKNARASASLQSKLKDAQDGRKAKPPKKKR